MALPNEDDHKDNYKEILEELFKERFDEIKELTDEINQNDLTYYFAIILLKKEFTGKASDHSNLKILSPKQMLQRLPVVLAQVKAGNTSENLLNEVRKIIYSLYRAKEITN